MDYFPVNDNRLREGEMSTMKRRDDWIPCIECENSKLNMYESEPLYSCDISGKNMFHRSMKEMMRHCPKRKS